MCTADLAATLAGTAAQSATSGSGAPYGFGGSAPADTSSIFTPGQATLALGAAGGALSILGNASKFNAGVTAAGAQAGQLLTNAKNAEGAAASAYATGAATVANTETKGALTVASQRTAMAANGIDISAPGTAQSVQESTQFVTQNNVDTITANAARAAMGYTQQSENDTSNALALTKASGANNPYLSGATSLLTSATGVASNWYRNQRAGVS